jgi:serine/threonine-protein kinase RsbW
METRQLRLTIDSDLRCVSLLGVSVRAVCLQEGISEEDAANIELCVVEASNNAIEHAYENQAGQSLEVVLALSQQGVSVAVRDHGKSIPEGLLEKLPQSIEFNPEELDAIPEGGMGLILVKSIMDQVSYSTKSGQNTLTMNRRIQL